MHHNQSVHGSGGNTECDCTDLVNSYFPSCAQNDHSYDAYKQSSPIIGMCVMGFDTLLGPVIWAQWPPKFINDDAFREISDKLVSGDEFASIPMILHISKGKAQKSDLTCVLFNANIADAKYHRNAFFFSIALFVPYDKSASMYMPVVQSVAEFLITVEKCAGRQAGRTKKRLKEGITSTKESEVTDGELNKMRAQCLVGIFELQQYEIPLYQKQMVILASDGLSLNIDCTSWNTPYTVDLSIPFDRSLFEKQYCIEEVYQEEELQVVETMKSTMQSGWVSADVLQSAREKHIQSYISGKHVVNSLMLSNKYIPGCDDILRIPDYLDKLYITPIETVLDVSMVSLGMVERHVLEQLTHTVSLHDLQEKLDIAQSSLLRVIQFQYELELVLLTVGLREDKPLVLQPTSHWCRGDCCSTLCLSRLQAQCAYIQQDASFIPDLEEIILQKTLVPKLGWRVTWATIARTILPLQPVKCEARKQDMLEHIYIFLLHSKILGIYNANIHSNSNHSNTKKNNMITLDMIIEGCLPVE